MKPLLRSFISILILFSLSFTGVVYSQKIDLVKLKKEEAERRKKAKQSKNRLNNANITRIKTSGKKYSYVKLKTVVPVEVDPATEEEATAAGEENPETESDTPDPTKTKVYWQDLKQGLEKNIRDNQKRFAEDQLRLNAYLTQFYSQESPIEKRRLMSQIQLLQDSQEKLRLTTDGLEKELADLPNKARQAGVPPGWVRRPL